MKSFREQFKQCREDGTAEIKKLDVPEELEIPPLQRLHLKKDIKTIKIDKVIFCNKYLKKCSSDVCHDERKMHR